MEANNNQPSLVPDNSYAIPFIGWATIDPPTIDPPTIDPPTIDPPTIDPPTIDPQTKSKLRLLFKAQKKAIRVVFGNKEQFLDKFRTCAKDRTYPDQKLGQEFFNKEHTKPLFIANHILTLQNLNFYHTCSEIFKIFKYRNPISTFEKFKFSARGS